MDVIQIAYLIIFGMPLAIFIGWTFACMLKILWLFGKHLFEDI